MKTTKILSAILCLFLAMSVFASCSSGEEEAIPSYDIREDVIKAYELDDEGKKIVCKAIGEMEDAFAALQAEVPVSDEELADFALAVKSARDNFDEKFYSAYDKPMKDRHQQALKDATNAAAAGGEAYEKAQEEGAFLSGILGEVNETYGKYGMRLTADFADYDKGEISAEGVSETALNYAIKFSEFFIGESIITDDMIDSIEFE